MKTKVNFCGLRWWQNNFSMDSILMDSESLVWWFCECIEFMSDILCQVISVLPTHLFLFQEIKVLSQLKHPNIVQYYGSEIVSNVALACLGIQAQFYPLEYSLKNHNMRSFVCRLMIDFIYIWSTSILVLLTNMSMNIVEP